MNRVEEWVPFSWHCVNCGNIVTGYKNSRGDIKVECRRCQTVMMRTLKTPKHDIIKVYAPEGMERMYAYHRPVKRSFTATNTKSSTGVVSSLMTQTQSW